MTPKPTVQVIRVTAEELARGPPGIRHWRTEGAPVNKIPKTAKKVAMKPQSQAQRHAEERTANRIQKKVAFVLKAPKEPIGIHKRLQAMRNLDKPTLPVEVKMQEINQVMEELSID